MAKELKLAKFFESNRVAKVDVRCCGIDSKFDPQRAAEFEFFQEFFFREDSGGSGGQVGELLFWGQGKGRLFVFIFWISALGFFHFLEVVDGFFGANNRCGLAGCFDDLVHDVKDPWIGRVTG